MSAVFSGPCKPSGEHADVCDVDPGLCGFDGALEVLGQPSAPAEPCKGSLDDPSTRQDLEAFGAVRPLDDLHRELADLLQGAPQFRAGIASISEDMAQPRPALEDGCQDGRRAVAILTWGLSSQVVVALR